MKAPRYIQDALDREFPGVRLEWNPLVCWWILTEHACWPNGMPARNAWIPRTGLLRGIELFDQTHRRALLFWGRIEEGVKEPLSLFAILEALRRAKKGTTLRDTEAGINALEEREEDRTARQKMRERSMSMDRARDVWKDMHQSMFGRYHARTDWTHTRAINAEYEKREREQYGDQAAAADAEVAQRLREGHGIAAARRERKREVVA